MEKSSSTLYTKISRAGVLGLVLFGVIRAGVATLPGPIEYVREDLGEDWDASIAYAQTGERESTVNSGQIGSAAVQCFLAANTMGLVRVEVSDEGPQKIFYRVNEEAPFDPEAVEVCISVATDYETVLVIDEQPLETVQVHESNDLITVYKTAIEEIIGNS